jgi:hypothetical protein
MCSGQLPTMQAVKCHHSRNGSAIASTAPAPDALESAGMGNRKQYLRALNLTVGLLLKGMLDVPRI